jgi:hypothetical protein
MPKIAKAKIWPLRTLGIKQQKNFKNLPHQESPFEPIPTNLTQERLKFCL